MHLTLLGDSIFDNCAYTSGAPDVIAYLRERVAPSSATLLAVDGAVCDDVYMQLQRLPPDATHLVLSAGGNDALMNADVLMKPVSSVAEAMFLLSEIAQAFEARYARLLDALLNRRLPLLVCTIYHPHFPDAFEGRITLAALGHFNEVIVRAAQQRGLPVLDLRAVCTDAADFAMTIEPSEQGGRKIAASIADVLAQHDFASRRTTLFPLMQP